MGINVTVFFPGDHSSGKPGKVRELQSGWRKLRKVWGNHTQFLQACEGKHIE